MAMIAQLDRAYLSVRPTRAWARLVAYGGFEGRPLTTRGRWINPFVFAHFAILSRVPRLRSVDAPIFLVGSGRSGSTLLGKILSLHAGVGFLNEPKALWHAALSDEDLIGSYARGPARVVLTEKDADPAVRRRLERLMGAFLFASGSRRLVDKYHELVYRIPFVRALFPDARFLFLVRDGRDACASVVEWNRRHAQRQGTERHDWWGAQDRKWKLLVDQVARKDADLGAHADELLEERDPTTRAALEWYLASSAGLAAEARAPEAVLRVRFEDLLADPTDTLQRIRAFFDLADDRAPREYAARCLGSWSPRSDRTGIRAPVAGPFEGMLERLGMR